MKPSELLSDASKWTKGVYARAGSRALYGGQDPEATCWCIKGAMERSIETFADQVYNPYYILVRDVVLRLFPERTKRAMKELDSDCPVAAFNDHPETTFEDVRKVLLAANL